MKGISKNKRGISLIVLVITIIVMIILASAIILSLRSSGIIGRANEAKTKSDIANAKEVISLAYAEWELDKENIGGTFSEYAMTKLQEAGFDTEEMYVTEEGELYTGAAAFFTKNNIAIGTDVTGYVLSTKAEAKTVSTDGSENTCDGDNQIETDPQPASLTRDDAITWKYFGIDENGEALIVGSVTSSSPKITLGGKGGYLNGPSTLNTICKTMYSSDMGTARSITIEDVTRVLEYTGERGAYWDEEMNYVPTTTVKRLEEIVGTYELDFLGDGKKIGTYELDAYTININEEEDKKVINEDMIDIIFTSDSSYSYWLASSSFDCDLGYDQYVCIRVVRSNSVGNEQLYSTGFVSSLAEYSIRPIVMLNSNVKMSYSNGIVTLK